MILKSSGVALAALALIVASAGPGLADDVSVATAQVSHLQDVNPGVSQSEILATATELAKENGLTVDETLQRMYDESAASVSSATTFRPMKEGEGQVPLGPGRNKGDIFTSPASTVGFQHGHDGIYYNQNTIVEAPGTSSNSRSISALTLMVGEGTTKESVSVSQTQRNAAADYAYNNMRGKPYNLVFFNNKQVPASKYNCSQLVWGAYLMATGIDLDSNGGWGVYPYDVRNSSYTTTYASVP